MIACGCCASSAAAPSSRRDSQYPVDPTFHCSFLLRRISMYSDNCYDSMQERQGWRREVSGKSSRSMLPDQSLPAIDHDDHFHGSSKTSRQEDYCGSPTRASYEGQPFLVWPICLRLCAAAFAWPAGHGYPGCALVTPR